MERVTGRSRPVPENTSVVVFNALLHYVMEAAVLASTLFLFPGDSWERTVKEWWPYSDRALFMVGTFVVHESLYFGMNTSFMLFDRWNWFLRYKIARKPSQVPSAALIRRTLRESFVNHFIVQWFSAYFLFPVFVHFGTRVGGHLPGYREAFCHFFVSTVVLDAGFFWAHRLIHEKMLYKWIHKQHHEYTGTIGFAAEYAHWVEQILGNQIPSIIGCALLGSHIFVWLVWLAYRLIGTYTAHSGYAFPGPFKYDAYYHDYHHSHNVGNFAGRPLWDHLCGTQDSWLRYIEKNGNEIFHNKVE